MAHPIFHPRFALTLLTEALRDTPVVLIHGSQLEGRMEILRLHPFVQSELAAKLPVFLDALFGGENAQQTIGRV